MSEMENLINKYFRPGRLPHLWCPGCGNGVITGAIVKAIDKQGLAKDDVAVISGIGCSSRSSGYLDFNTANTLHGRALPIATGVKMANPALNVIVCSGDGDCTAIGGNHLIHAARRNIDLTLVVFNNSIYGMTGGQYSPMTPMHSKATTAPYYTVEPSFNLLDLAKAAGATYVARATTYHVPVLVDVIAKGIAHKGFSIIEAVSACPISFGRQNKMGGPGQGLITAGIILAEAALLDDKLAVQSQSYGPEARGGSSKAEAIISDEPIYFSRVICPDTLLVMSQEAANKFIADCDEHTTVITDTLFVTDVPGKYGKRVDLPITHTANTVCGKTLFANIVALGAVVALTKCVSKEAILKAVLNRVPKGTEEANTKALEAGMALIEK